MMRSLSSAVAGLRAHQTKMDVIGNNIANVNTYGYKSSRTTFTDVYYQTLNSGRGAQSTRGGQNPTQIGYGAQVATIDMYMTNAGGAFTGRPYDVYVDGDGFLTVQDADGATHYTRLGNLTFDSDGWLVDYSGYKVMGIQLQSYTDGTPVPSGTGGFWDASQLVQIKLGQATTDVAYATKITGYDNVNYDVYLATHASANFIDSNFDLPTGTVNNIPVSLFAAANPGVDYTDPSTLDAAFPGALYDQATGTISGMSLADYQQIDPGYTPSTDPSFTFNPSYTNGDLSTYGTVRVPVSAVTTTPSKTDNIRAFINNISIGSDGSITAVVGADLTYEGVAFKKDDPIYLGKIAIGTFANPYGLQEAGQSYFDEAPNSGGVQYTEPDKNGAGKTKAGYLEMANVDLAQEFTDMITTQRGFQANTRIITVSDEMLQELVNLKR